MVLWPWGHLVTLIGQEVKWRSFWTDARTKSSLNNWVVTFRETDRDDLDMTPTGGNEGTFVLPLLLCVNSICQCASLTWIRGMIMGELYMVTLTLVRGHGSTLRGISCLRCIAGCCVVHAWPWPSQGEYMGEIYMVTLTLSQGQG